MIGKEHFRAFERLRESGRFNMLTEYKLVLVELGISQGEYAHILDNYMELREEYRDEL